MPIEIQSFAPQWLVLGALIVGCVVSSKLSTRFSMPGLLVFLLIGMGMHLFVGGSYGNEEVEQALTWEMANAVGTLALAFILFSGGLDSDWSDIRRVFRTGTILSTVGVLLTTLILGGVGIIVSACLGHGEQWPQCLLFGAVISSTDASAVFSILRSKRISLQGDLKPLLEYESGSNDPMATFLTMFFLGLCLSHSEGDGGALKQILWIIPKFFYQMGVGTLLGMLVGAGAVWLYNHLKPDYDGLYYVLCIAVVLLSYSLADVCKANGFMATYVGGVFMGNRRFVFHNSVSRFADGMAWLMQVMLFTILGFMANPGLIFSAYGILGLVMGIVLMFIARPVATFLCMSGSGFSAKAKVLVSWVGLRGGAPIMLATFPMIYAENSEAVVQQAAIGATSSYEILFNLVFCMVLLSVVVQSFTIMPLARYLGLDSPLQMTPTAPISFDQVTFHEGDDWKQQEENSDDLSYNEPASYMIPKGSDLDGRRIRELHLPKGVFIVMLSRNGKWLVPRGETPLKCGDLLSVLATPANQRAASEYFTAVSHRPREEAPKA